MFLPEFLLSVHHFHRILREFSQNFLWNFTLGGSEGVEGNCSSLSWLCSISEGIIGWLFALLGTRCAGILLEFQFSIEMSYIRVVWKCIFVYTFFVAAKLQQEMYTWCFLFLSLFCGGRAAKIDCLCGKVVAATKMQKICILMQLHSLFIFLCILIKIDQYCQEFYAFFLSTSVKFHRIF